MPAHDEARSSFEQEEILDVQRRRASVHGWQKLVLGMALFLAGVLWLPLGTSVGQLTATDLGAILKSLKGAGTSVVWGWIVFWLFRQSAIDFSRERGREDFQLILHVLRKYGKSQEVSLLTKQLAAEGAAGILDPQSAEKKTGVRVRKKKGERAEPADLTNPELEVSPMSDTADRKAV